MATIVLTWLQAVLRLEWTGGWFEIAASNVHVAAIGTLLILIAVNVVFRWAGFETWRLNRTELLAVYSLVAVALSYADGRE